MAKIEGHSKVDLEIEGAVVIEDLETPTLEIENGLLTVQLNSNL